MLAPMKASSHVLLVLALWASVVGCAKSIPEAESAHAIRVERAAPPAGARMLRELKAVDGHGCGIFGTLGTYEGAVALLREQARAIGSDYVRITDVKEPAATHECVEKAYTLTGVAYVVRAAPAPVAPATSGSATPVATAPRAVAPLPSRGLPLGKAGCAFGSLAPGSARLLSFSARVPRGSRFGAWVDRVDSTPAPAGVALDYDPAARRIALVRRPGNVAVTVGPEPFELDDGWHEWRILRAADRISVWLDDRLLLLYAAPAPSATAELLLEGDGVELRQVTVATPETASSEPAAPAR